MNTTLKNFYIDLFKSSITEAKREIFPKGDKKYAIDLLPTEFMDLLKVEAFKTVGDYSVDITKRAKNMLIHSIKDSVGEAETLKIIRDGLKQSTETWIKTVSRTKSTEIYNEARKRYWETDPLAKQIVVAYQWSSILDDRTSDICRYMDGKIYKIGEISNRVKPPAHFGCRSLLVPITKFEAYDESPMSDFNPDRLKGLGGGLLQVGGNARATKFAVDEPALMNPDTKVFNFGNTLIIPAQGDGSFIKIISIYVANQEQDKDIAVGFRDEHFDLIESDLKFKTILKHKGNVIEKSFPEGEQWQLSENSGLIINLDKEGQVECTIQFIVVNEKGWRIK